MPAQEGSSRSQSSVSHLEQKGECTAIRDAQCLGFWKGKYNCYIYIYVGLIWEGPSIPHLLILIIARLRSIYLF